MLPLRQSPGEYQNLTTQLCLPCQGGFVSSGGDVQARALVRCSTLFRALPFFSPFFFPFFPSLIRPPFPLATAVHGVPGQHLRVHPFHLRRVPPRIHVAPSLHISIRVRVRLRRRPPWRIRRLRHRPVILRRAGAVQIAGWRHRGRRAGVVRPPLCGRLLRGAGRAQAPSRRRGVAGVRGVRRRGRDGRAAGQRTVRDHLRFNLFFLLFCVFIHSSDQTCRRYGTVFAASWRGTPVAVKVFRAKDAHGGSFGRTPSTAGTPTAPPELGGGDDSAQHHRSGGSSMSSVDPDVAREVEFLGKLRHPNGAARAGRRGGCVWTSAENGARLGVTCRATLLLRVFCQFSHCIV